MKRANLHLIVDLGGVLFEFDHPHRLQVMSAAFGIPPERLHELLWTSGFSADADVGRYASSGEVRDRIRAITGFAGTDDDIDATWCSAFRPDPAVRKALELHNGSLTLFTNNGPLEEEVLRRRHPEMFDGFDQVLFSYRLGHSKPEPAAFSAVAGRLAAAPEELVFVDDSPANTEMARSLGWTAYTFEGAETIERARARVHTFRPAIHADLPGLLALLADEDNVVDPATVVVTEVYERAFAAIESDPRNELLVLADADGAIVGCLQATYIPGLSRGGVERALIKAVHVRADRRGRGLGRTLMERAANRARERGCALIQLTSDKQREGAHRFYAALGYAQSHEGFKLAI